MSTGTRRFIESLNGTRTGLKLLFGSACAVLLVSTIGGCAVEPHDRVTVLTISGRVTNESGEPLRATVSLLHARDFFSDFQFLGAGTANANGEFHITGTVDRCVSLHLKASMTGYLDYDTFLSEHDVICTTRPQVFELSMSPRPPMP